MNKSFCTVAQLICLVLITASSAVAQQSHFVRLTNPSVVFRGQSKTYSEPPDSGASGNGYDTSPDAFNGGGTPRSVPLGQDPFNTGGFNTGVTAPYGINNGGGQYSYGVNGSQPYRFGWTSRYDFGHLFGEKVSGTPGVSGDFSITEFDAEWEHTSSMGADWVFSFTPQFGIRLWDGPNTAAGTPGLPGQVFRFGADLKLATASKGPWNFQMAFNPSINTDFNQGLSMDAVNWDGRAMLFYRASPQWMWVGGIGYWDRVNDKILPYAGAVWTPNDILEFRMIFPKPRISLFLGNMGGAATWAYVSGEYHVEAYEIGLAGVGGKDQIEIEDWRLMLGLRSDYGPFQAFVEGGWVFNREVSYGKSTPGFDISDGALIRAGLRF